MFIALFVASVTVFSTIAVVQNIREAKSEALNVTEARKTEETIKQAA